MRGGYRVVLWERIAWNCKVRGIWRPRLQIKSSGYNAHGKLADVCNHSAKWYQLSPVESAQKCPVNKPLYVHV